MRFAQAMLLALLVFACTGPELGATDEQVPLSGTITRSEVRIQEKWRPLVKILSKTPKKTPPFRVAGKEWRIHWKNKGQGEFILILYDANNPDYSEIIANTTSQDEDVVYLTGKGQYILEVVAKQPYEVIVEELR